MSQIRRTSLVQGPPGAPTNKSAATAWTPGAILNGAFASLAVSVPGAAVGFAALAAWSAVLPDGVWLWAQVTTTGNTKAYMFNNSGSTQTPAPGTVFVEVMIS